jgi:hypothetical protein
VTVQALAASLADGNPDPDHPGVHLCVTSSNESGIPLAEAALIAEELTKIADQLSTS